MLKTPFPKSANAVDPVSYDRIEPFRMIMGPPGQLGNK